MFMDGGMTQIQPGNGSIYRMRRQGALNSPTLDWDGKISILSEEHRGNLLVSLTIDTGTLHEFLDQFHNLSLTIVLKKDPENENRSVVNPR
jgi:hypothetical protein